MGLLFLLPPIVTTTVLSNYLALLICTYKSLDPKKLFRLSWSETTDVVRGGDEPKALTG
jgi:hypothetical protein